MLLTVDNWCWWTSDMNIELIKCWLLSQPDVRGFRKRLFAIWSECNPSMVLSEGKLAGQVYALNRRGEFSSLEIERFKRELNLVSPSVTVSESTCSEATADVPPDEQRQSNIIPLLGSSATAGGYLVAILQLMCSQINNKHLVLLQIVVISLYVKIFYGICVLILNSGLYCLSWAR